MFRAVRVLKFTSFSNSHILAPKLPQKHFHAGVFGDSIQLQRGIPMSIHECRHSNTDTGPNGCHFFTIFQYIVKSGTKTTPNSIPRYLATARGQSRL